MGDTLVEQLEFGANDEHGSFVEALVIRTPQGDHYVLHRAHPNDTNTAYVNEKVEFGARAELLAAFPYAFGRTWQRTDDRCGYDIPQQEFRDADKRRLDQVLKASRQKTQKTSKNSL